MAGSVAKRLFIFQIIAVVATLVAPACTGVRPGSKSATADEINTRKSDAHALMETGEYERAVALLLPLSERNSRDAQIDGMLGEAYWRLGDYASATTHFENALRLDHGAWDTHMKLAQMLTEQKKTGRALTEFELAIDFGAREPIAHYNYGLALFEFGRTDQAIVEWETALSLDRRPEYAEALGMAYTNVDTGEALDYFRMAGELGADDANFHNNFGLLLLRRNDPRDAARHFDAAVARAPENEGYRFNLAVAYLREGRFAAAAPLLEKRIAVLPDDRPTRIYLGRAYYELGRPKDCIALLDGWMAAQKPEPRPGRPGLAEGYDVLAMSFRNAGDLESAADRAAHAVALEPENPVYLNNYGVILAESGRIEAAKAQWAKVLDLEPDNATARQNLSAFGR